MRDLYPKDMTEKDSNTEDILNEVTKKLLDGHEINNILANPKEFPTELIEKLSVIIALKYWNGEINYTDGDSIMNNLFGFWVTNNYYVDNYAFPGIAWQCYDAFDAGEYYRTDDDKRIDPPEKYTKPLIEELLKKLNKI
jgi:hypothetical protein